METNFREQFYVNNQLREQLEVQYPPRPLSARAVKKNVVVDLLVLTFTHADDSNKNPCQWRNVVQK